MMKLPVKVRREIQKALDCTQEALAILDNSLGYATPIAEDMARGSHYDLRNPKCMETTSGLSKHIRVSPVFGSKLIYAYTARDTLKRMLENDDAARAVKV